MNKVVDLTVLIPVHSVAGPNFLELMTSALQSIDANEVQPAAVTIVRCGCSEVKEVIDAIDFSTYKFKVSVLENKEGRDFQTQINYGAKHVMTEYFTFLEFDDEFSINWFKNVAKYMESYPNIDMFLPIISDVTPENKFLGFSNEAAWAYNFSENLGMIDHEVLLEYPNINPSGMVVRTSTFSEVGGYKKSFMLTFNYEFLLRFTNGGRNIMVIPKVGYKHMNMRENSLFWNYKHSDNESELITPELAKHWMEKAKNEFHFTQDRDATAEV
jgi:GT2 family glycosyltransferase